MNLQDKEAVLARAILLDLLLTLTGKKAKFLETVGNIQVWVDAAFKGKYKTTKKELKAAVLPIVSWLFGKTDLMKMYLTSPFFEYALETLWTKALNLELTLDDLEKLA